MHDILTALENLGISGTEARIYTALLSGGPSGAPGLAERLEVARGTVYGALRSLTEAGLVEGGTGYGKRYRALPPEEALPTLIERQRAALHEREMVTKKLVPVLAELAEGTTQSLEETVQIFRDPRVIGDRFDRLQLEAEETIEVLVKAPILNPRPENPVERAVLDRGTRARAVYEEAVLAHEGVLQWLENWTAWGEEARVYPGELPLKLALFDRRAALMPLETPHERHAVTAILIRHEALGEALGMLFDQLWESSGPL